MTYCCEVFPKIAIQMNWIYMGLQDNPYYSIPHVGNGDIRLGVNFCPSCGADIRGIVISKDEFDKLK